MIIEVGKYAKLAILASLAESKSLSELGIFWYNENGRFYKKKAREEITQALDKDFLIKNSTKLKANTEKLVAFTYDKIKDKNLKETLCKFWCHPFSQKTFLCCEVLKQMFSNSPEKAANTSLNYVLNTPLILQKLQETDLEMYSLFVTNQELEEYIRAIHINAEKNITKAFMNLKQKTDWVENLNKIIKNNGRFLNSGNVAMMKIKQMMKKRK